MSAEWIFSIIWCTASLTLVLTTDYWIDTKFGKAIQAIWDPIVRVTTKILNPITRRF